MPDLSTQVHGRLLDDLEFNQMEPNTLIIKWLDKPMEVRRTGTGFVSDIAAYNTRIPAGHPEGYLEAFADIHRNAATCIQHILEGREAPEEARDFPAIYEGLRGMKFVDKAVESSIQALMNFFLAVLN